MPERGGRAGQSLSMVIMLVIMAAFAIGLGVLMGRYAFGLLTSGHQEGGDAASHDTTGVATTEGKPDATGPVSALQSGDYAPGTVTHESGDTVSGAPDETGPAAEESALAPPTTAGLMLYRVQVGGFDDRPGAEALARELGGAGYPGFVTAGAPYRVQVGAFADKANADRLAAEIEARGYSVVVVH